MNHKLLLYTLSFVIVSMLFSCKKETTRPIEATPAPVLHISSEIIIPELEWNHWHSPNDPDHLFDEIYLWIKDTTNSIPNYTTALMEIWVKRDSTSEWERAAGTVINGTPWPPFTYDLYPDRLVIFMWYPFDSNMLRKKAQVKIRF